MWKINNGNDNDAIAVTQNHKNVDPITRAHLDTHPVAAVDAKVPFADIAIGPDQFIRGCIAEG